MSELLGRGAVRASLFALSTLLVACASDPKPSYAGGPSPSENDGDDAGTSGDDPEDACPEDNPYCQDDGDDKGNDCGSEAIDLTPVGVNIMVAVDGASSMSTHWTTIQNAIKALRDSHPDSNVGLQIFWGEIVGDLQEGLSKSNWCGQTKNHFLDVGANTAKALVDFLGAMPPGPSFVDQTWETSPVIEPLNYYLNNTTKLADPARTNYLVFVTNGNDNCFGSVFSKQDDKLLAYEKLAVELGKLNIRVIPVGFDASAKPGSTGNFGTINGNTDLEVLQTLLKFGNSGLNDVPKADDPAKLGDVLTQVGEVVRNCRFEIPAALNPTDAINPFQLDFSINNKIIQRDRLRAEGWNFVDGNTSQVELFGKACQAVQGKAKLEAHKTCADDICGTAAVKVETKPRAVQYLLDSSWSRTECVDGSVWCKIPPGVGVMRPNSYWEVVEHALGVSLVAPINDDIDFGMQFFPGKNAEAFTCDVATNPEIPPAQGTEISIMSAMLEKLPLGTSPVVQVLENVAAAPGRLADPNVEGAVVMLSDGGDNCAGVDQATVVTRLGAAAAKLLAAGVETYVVRYGSDAAKTPEQDAQLRAIVANGGTASSDPSDMSKVPYVDAKSDQELSDALASISSKLATCSFALGGLPADADKTRANLYLNGEVIPFDSAHKAEKGWAWQDEATNSVQLFGESCDAFKTNRKTSVVVEFGCEPIDLL
ncbi:MAG: hypothetical protein QM778_15765 [Myxococcales bacterium]